MGQILFVKADPEQNPSVSDFARIKLNLISAKFLQFI